MEEEEEEEEEQEEEEDEREEEEEERLAEVLVKGVMEGVGISPGWQRCW